MGLLPFEEDLFGGYNGYQILRDIQKENVEGVADEDLGMMKTTPEALARALGATGCEVPPKDPPS